MIEGLKQEKSPYGKEWFRDRALNGLRKINEYEWDYSDSLLLYISESEDKYEAVQETDTAYNKLVTTPERAYLENIAPLVVGQLPRQFEYIDLGPGTEHKEQFFFDAARLEGKEILYRPIDISPKYLRMATEYASKQGIETNPLRASFEELSEKMGQTQLPRFVSIGLTYGNYEPARILSLLREISGVDGTSFINSQIRERADMNAIRETYAEVMPGMVEEKIRLLGLNPGQDISSIETTDEVKVWCVLERPSPELEARGLRPKDRLLLFQSLRPTRAQLEQDLSNAYPNYKLIDTGESFVAAVLK